MARLRVLVVGCGDVGLRLCALLKGRVQLLALTSNPQRVTALRAQGLKPLLANLDQPQALARLAGLAHRVVHLAPPAASGATDTRTRALCQALSRRPPPSHLVYVSTTGVYGDAQGAWRSETDSLRPATERAYRRVDAEACLRHWGKRVGAGVSVLRAPGIYATDRPGGHPAQRLQRGSPVLRHEDDVFTNHIHADDLARACLLALFRGRGQRVFNASDDSELRMGDYFDLAADLCGLPRPQRVSRQEAKGLFSPLQLSFMSESRRLRNARIKRELRLRLRHPTALVGLRGRPVGGG
jgi:nucleoside-diphosphate-sugar epimerase